MYTERFELSSTRIREIADEKQVKEPFAGYFTTVAAFVGKLVDPLSLVSTGRLYEMELDELKALNHSLYEDVLPEIYENSYANPAYAVSVMKEAGFDGEYGQLLSFLYTELRGLIPYVFEQNLEIIVIYLELFIEIYDLFTYADDDTEPSIESLKKAIYWFESDYCDIMIPDKLDEQLNPKRDFAKRIITECDLSNPKYLYYYGEYISENELGLVKLLNSMDEQEITDLARVYTEGYRIGFISNGKDITKKEVAEVRFALGLEKMVKAAIPMFGEMGLAVTMRRAATLSLNRRGCLKIGYCSTEANKQYEFDHREDEAIYYDKDFVNRRVSVLKAAFEERKSLANHHAGPACMETFGSTPIDLQSKPESYTLNKKQQKLRVDYSDQSGRIINEYIIGEERSFTIISFPKPEIGKDFEAIFRETVKVNTLDYILYRDMQQIIIDTLDRAKFVRIKGKGVNRTDLTVALYDLQNPAEETIFENCVADVNIPVGEVFTSPKLKGTNGLLNVSQVFLDGLKYVDLEVEFRDGVISNYNCKNFPSEEDNKRYIKENILYHHEFLPMGEFAIGTNTTAYKMAVTYGIQDRLDILIGEKTGPHFAVGDTCYSYDEDLITKNPDGKRIVARENDFSAKRKENPKEAYFHCHTDITIPYDELAEITAIGADGSETPIIIDGLFVLKGLEDLNKPLLELGK